MVEPFSANQVRSASYDLRVGVEYSVGDNRDVKVLGPKSKAIEIPANEVALVRTEENLQLPSNIVGHLSLKLDVLLQGLIMSSQSQIDAGYCGPIYSLLYNLGTSPVILHYKQSLLRLEFATLDVASARPYKGDIKPDFTLADAIAINARGRINSGLSSLRKELNDGIDRQQREIGSVKKRQIIQWVGIAGAVLAIVGAGATYVVPFLNDAAKAKQQVDDLNQTVLTLDETVRLQQQQIEALKVAAASSPPSGVPGPTG